MNWQTEKLETRRGETPVTLGLEGKEIVGRFREAEMFRVAGDVSRAVTRRKVLTALRKCCPICRPKTRRKSPRRASPPTSPRPPWRNSSKPNLR